MRQWFGSRFGPDLGPTCFQRTLYIYIVVKELIATNSYKIPFIISVVKGVLPSVRQDVENDGNSEVLCMN